MGHNGDWIYKTYYRAKVGKGEMTGHQFVDQMDDGLHELKPNFRQVETQYPRTSKSK